MLNASSLLAVYDRSADVLYITRRREAAGRGVEDPNGIVWRYGGAGDVIGATVLDFGETWFDRRAQLAGEIARGFAISPSQAADMVDRAFDDQALGGERRERVR
ncbi:MAG TPA: hypothetical protein VM434_08420 [Beijerinckiaceae bacterium]|nr:hypothetical protein [Beijerinckiaceae bacterium]